MANQIDNKTIVTSQDVIHLRRYVFEERQVSALENLLHYAIDEASSLRFRGCERSLRDALEELCREAGRPAGGRERTER